MRQYIGLIGICIVMHAPAIIGAEQPPVSRGGFHFQVSFGYGIGPTSNGLMHNMEIGHTLRKSGTTLGLQHTFVLSNGIAKRDGDEDLVGGWMFQAKYPLTPRIVPKLAIGLGGIHDQSDGIKASGGLGLSYGIDYHFPVNVTTGLAGIRTGNSHGFTLSFQAINVYVPSQKKGHFWAGIGVGYTWF